MNINFKLGHSDRVTCVRVCVVCVSWLGLFPESQLNRVLIHASEEFRMQKLFIYEGQLASHHHSTDCTSAYP